MACGGGVGTVTVDSLLGLTDGMDGGKWIFRKQVVDWRRLMTLEQSLCFLSLSLNISDVQGQEMITDDLVHSVEKQVAENKVWFVTFGEQIQNGTHQDGGHCVAFQGRMDQ